MATEKQKIERWEKKNESNKKDKFCATLTSKDRYNYKIFLPECFAIPKTFEKTPLCSFDTGSTNTAERLFNAEYVHIDSLEEVNSEKNPSKEIIIPKKFAKDTGLQKGDVIEIIRFEKDGKITFFCSDTTKNEETSDVQKSLKEKMSNKKLYFS